MYGLPSVGSRSGRERPGWLLGAKAAALVAGTVLALALGLTSVWGGGGAATESYEVVTVQPGDTVWGIASARYPDSDVRGRVDEIMRVNRLSGSVLQPGQRLEVPSSGGRVP